MQDGVPGCHSYSSRRRHSTQRSVGARRHRESDPWRTIAAAVAAPAAAGATVQSPEDATTADARDPEGEISARTLDEDGIEVRGGGAAGEQMKE